MLCRLKLIWPWFVGLTHRTGQLLPKNIQKITSISSNFKMMPSLNHGWKVVNYLVVFFSNLCSNVAHFYHCLSLKIYGSLICCFPVMASTIFTFTWCFTILSQIIDIWYNSNVCLLNTFIAAINSISHSACVSHFTHASDIFRQGLSFPKRRPSWNLILCTGLSFR
jgi:hypothetical protein